MYSLFSIGKGCKDGARLYVLCLQRKILFLYLLYLFLRRKERELHLHSKLIFRIIEVFKAIGEHNKIGDCHTPYAVYLGNDLFDVRELGVAFNE